MIDTPSRRAILLFGLGVLPLLFCISGCRRSSTGDRPSHPPPASGPMTPLFTDASDEAGFLFTALPRRDAVGYGQGVAVADFDGDGDLDIFLPQDDGPSALYRNDGRWTFTEIAAAAGVDLGPASHAKCAAAFDYDRDGDMDLFVGGSGRPDRLLRNRGDMTFEDVSAAAGVGGGTAFTVSAAVGDFDGDGHPDLYLCRFTPTDFDNPFTPVLDPSPNGLLWNGRDGTFTGVAALLGVDDAAPSWAAHFTDLNGDGRQDLLVVNDVAFPTGVDIADRAFLGSGPPGFAFTDDAAALGLAERHSGMGIALADLDGDGEDDLYTTDFGPSELRLTGGPPPWADVAPGLGVDEGRDDMGRFRISWGVAAEDLDGDGRRDLLVVRGVLAFVDPGPTASGAQVPSLFLSRPGPGGALAFEESSAAAGLRAVNLIGARACIPADLDGDGDLDLVVSTRIGRARLLRNDTRTPGDWYGVRVRGTTACTEGWGTRLELRRGDAVVRATVTAGGQPGATLPPERILRPGPGARGTAVLRVTFPSGETGEVEPRRNGWTVLIE